MKRVLVGGAIYGCHNIGDDGLLRGILKDLENCECGVITKQSKWMEEEYPEVKQFEWLNIYRKPRLGCYIGGMRKLSTWKENFFPDMTAYRWSDVLICGGGTIFSACPWNAFRLTTFEKRLHKPTIIWGAGMCDETDSSTIRLIRKWCNDSMVLHVYVRDELVQKRLWDIGVEARKVSVCYDPAYILAPRKVDVETLSEKVQKMLASTNKKLVLTLSGEDDVSNQVELAVFKDFIDKVVRKGYEVFLIPISYANHTKDRLFAKELDKINSKQVCFIKNEFQPQELIDFLTKVDVSISSRLHMSIYSAVAGIPFISLKRNDKNSDLAKLFDMPCFSFYNLKASELIDSLYQLIDDEPALKRRVAEQAEKYKKIHIEMSKELKELINSI